MQRDKLLTKYYNKHKEDLRLTRRHGMVEFRVSMHYIKQFLPENCNGLKILGKQQSTVIMDVNIERDKNGKIKRLLVNQVSSH